jgi:hypothetical protein
LEFQGLGTCDVKGTCVDTGFHLKAFQELFSDGFNHTTDLTSKQAKNTKTTVAAYFRISRLERNGQLAAELRSTNLQGIRT